jgi:hypothetical protein
MGRLNWAEEKEKIRKEALERHERLHRLFVEDRLAFERERRNAVNDLINSAEDPEQREKLRAFQESWDRKMRHAGSRENRFVLAQTFFWEHFHEVWEPSIKEFSTLLNDKFDS